MASTLRYPLETVGQYIAFTRYPHNRGSVPTTVIAIAAPPGFTIADGAGYGSVDLGVIGANVAASIGNIEQGLASSEKIKKNILSDVNAKDATFVLQSVLANNGLGGSATEKFRTKFSRNNGIAFNPNSVLQFNNMNARNYQFEFTAVPSSPEEWKEIKRIIENFRESMYPESRTNSILLDYPDKWKFSFESEAANQIPKSFECFLTDMSVSYNTTGNVQRKDGAPSDVSISLAFQETKTLSRSDINKLNPGYTGE